MTARQVEQLAKRGELAHVECKEASGGRFSISGVPNATELIKRFWDGVNNREKVSVNILFDRHVYSVKCRGRDVVVIEVPRADRQDRPVYIGKDMFNGSFRRNGEGDYHCPRESVKAMLRDACVETADACLLDELTVDDLSARTIHSYRSRFKSKKPGHIWNDLPDEEFLVRIRAARRGEDGKVHPNLAGLVCFAEFGQIMDILPDFFLDYRERLSTDTRWTDRVAAHDATWSGNIYDFYLMVYDRITSHVKVPFEIDSEGLRVEENEMHRSIRELLANALIHADYRGRRGIVIEKQAQTISFSNPGVFRVNKAVAVEGGTSDARNSHIFNIFALVDIGERSGMGLADLYGHWKRYDLPEPAITEEYDPDRVKITVYTDSGQVPIKRNPDQSIQGFPKNPKGASESDQDPTKTRPRPDQDPTKTRPIAWSDLPASCRQVYEALRQDAFLTYRGMVSKLGLNKDTINTAIGTLVQKGFIRREGNKQTGHWEVVTP